MATESQQQIADEYANDFIGRLRQWQGFSLTEYQQNEFRKSFLSAIERAHQDGWHEGRTYETKFGVKPQRSEHLLDVEVCFCGQEVSKHDQSHDILVMTQRSEHRHAFPSDGGACDICGYTARELLSASPFLQRSDHDAKVRADAWTEWH